MITCADTEQRFRYCTVIDYIWEKTPEGIAARQHSAIAAKALAKAVKDRQRTVYAVVKKVLGTAVKAAERARRDALSPKSKRDGWMPACS